MNEPDLAVLDGDIIVYRAACAADSKGWTPAELERRIAEDVSFWTPRFCTRHINAISCRRNFRYDVFSDYKANRKGKPRPANLELASNIMHSNHPTIARDRLEADDLIGLGMSSGLAVGVSLDKDLMSVPGWFWNPDKMCFPSVISEEDADAWFYRQWLMGDTTDNIKGASKVGKVKSEKIINENSPANWLAAVLAEYERRGHTWDYCVQQARLVRILRDGEYNKETGEINLWEPPLPLTAESKRD